MVFLISHIVATAPALDGGQSFFHLRIKLDIKALYNQDLPDEHRGYLLPNWAGT